MDWAMGWLRDRVIRYAMEWMLCNEYSIFLKTKKLVEDNKKSLHSYRQRILSYFDEALCFITVVEVDLATFAMGMAPF